MRLGSDKDRTSTRGCPQFEFRKKPRPLPLVLNFEQIPIGPVCPIRPSVRPPVRPSVRPSGSVRVRPGPSGSVRSVRSVRVRPDGLMMLITYVIHRTVDDHRSNRTRPARPARPARPGPSGPSRVRLAGWVGLSGRGLLQSMPTLQIPQCTLCAVIHWGTSNISQHGQPLVLVRS